MKIILKEDVPSLGRVGDIKEVRNGYARNYLIPKGLAVPATEGNIKMIQQIKKAREKREAREREKYLKIKEKIDALPEIVIRVKVTEGGNLYGSVNAGMIYEKIRESGIEEIEKSWIKLEEPIKELGLHEVKIHLFKDIETAIKIRVESENDREVINK